MGKSEAGQGHGHCKQDEVRDTGSRTVRGTVERGGAGWEQWDQEEDKDTEAGDWDMGSRKIMEALGAEWVMGTMGAGWEWRE